MKDQKKRRRKKQKRKQTSTEEDEKQGSERENFEDKLNDKLIDDGPGEEIITHYGDEQCVVSYNN